MNQEHSLFWGEFVVAPDGIYTYAHYYEHPATKRRVIFVGMNHGGDKEYFESAAKILEDAEVVLYEDLPRDQNEDESEARRSAEEDLHKLSSENIDEAFYPAIRTYFRKVREYLRLVSEGSMFDYSKSGWESGDAEFFVRLKSDETLHRFLGEQQKNLIHIAPERKREVVKYVKRALKGIESGRFTKKDLGDGFVFFWSDENLVSIILDALGKPRDEIVLGRFDKIVRERNPRVVGIKFGAAHITYQRKLLEQRGYVLQRSVKLKNLSF
ncbi:MAG: hypothetical protein HYT98_04780 [Candidatus Sungbacteria bacterium]|nr:hypothetical protein [Candidatus Sungbacteria bacterium]